jgi:hypothetical protein
VSSWIRTAAALAAGLVVGAAATLAFQNDGVIPAQQHTSGAHVDTVEPASTPERPTTVLAWVPAGIPAGFGDLVRALPDIDRVTVVAEDNAWMIGSSSAEGDVVDRPPAPYMIPIDAAAVDPGTFGDFLPLSDRSELVALRRGKGILGATSAELRGLGPGSVMRFQGGTEVTIAAVFPDELVGAAELMVSRATGERIGVTHDRYLLLRPSGKHAPSSSRIARTLRKLLPATGSPYQDVVVRSPGETPYFRQGDAVLPPVLIKALFGEFAARPDPARPGYLKIDPAWVRQHIVTTTVPVLGTVTCNRGLIPQLRAAMQTLVRKGLSDSIHAYNGCYAPRFINRIPTNPISHHAWGIAFDCNADLNPVGTTPDQDPRLVRVLEQAGFIWGGSFAVPDGNHFEYRMSPAGASESGTP